MSQLRSKKDKTVSDTPIIVEIKDGIRYEVHLPLSEWFNGGIINRWTNAQCAELIKTEAGRIIDNYRLYSEMKNFANHRDSEVETRRHYAKSAYALALKTDDKTLIAGAWYAKIDPYHVKIYISAKESIANKDLIIETLDELIIEQAKKYHPISIITTDIII